MIVVVSLARKFKKIEKVVKRAGEKLLKLSKMPGNQVEIYLVGNRFMRKNVLAFPAPAAFPQPDVRRKAIGEIYLNPDYIREHQEDLIYMLVHGFLHLLGYDHKKKSDRLKMENKEKTLCQQIS